MGVLTGLATVVIGAVELSAPVLTVIGTVFLAFFVRAFFRDILRPLTGMTRTKLDDQIVRSLQNPIFWTIIVAGFYFALVQAFPQYADVGTTVAKVLIILIVGKAVKNLVSDVLFGESIRFFPDETKKKLLSVKGIIDAVIYVAVILMGLSAVGIDIWPILAPLGITGVALGFAVKDIATNYVSGIILAVDKDLVAGKRITVKEKGITGTIEYIGWRSTVIVTDEGKRVHVPNSVVLNSVVIEEE